MRPSVPLRWLVPLTMAMIALVGCGDDEPDVEAARSDQVRDAAIEAGLPEDVADVLALAATGATATFQMTYPGSDGASVVISQSPPNRRVDVVASGLIVESTVVRSGVAYRCLLPEGARPGDGLECERTSGTAEGAGTFTDEALAEFTDALAASLDRVDLTVEDRTIADTDATCLVSSPKAGTPLDGTGDSVDTICLSPDGAQLLVDVGGERVVADTYVAEVPEGTFDTS